MPSSFASNKIKTNLEFNIPNKSNSAFKLRKSITLNSSSRKPSTPNTATNSTTNVNNEIVNTNEEIYSTQSKKHLKSIYVNGNFDILGEYNRYNEPISPNGNINVNHKLNETIVKSSRTHRESPMSPSQFSIEKTPSLSSSTSSKIRITSYTLNHQNQIELQQQLKNSNNKSINRLAYSRSKEASSALNSKNNLGLSNSKTKLTTEANATTSANSTVKLARVTSSIDHTHRKTNAHSDEPSKNRHSLFISSASNLISNEKSNNQFLSNATNYATKQHSEHVAHGDDTEIRKESSKIIDSMANFIDELKDFVDDRLNDTTSQLEMANQRITGLYECFNFVAGEFSLLKFQNDELLKELKQYYHTYGKSRNIIRTEPSRKSKNCQPENEKSHKVNNEKKSSETSSAISSFPIKSSRKSKKAYELRANDMSYSITGYVFKFKEHQTFFNFI